MTSWLLVLFYACSVDKVVAAPCAPVRLFYHETRAEALEYLETTVRIGGPVTLKRAELLEIAARERVNWQVRTDVQVEIQAEPWKPLSWCGLPVGECYGDPGRSRVRRSRSPEGTLMAREPDDTLRRRFEVTIKIGADDADSAIRLLNHFAFDMESRGLREITSGGPNSGGYIMIDEDPSITHDEWVRRMRIWREKRAAGEPT